MRRLAAILAVAYCCASACSRKDTAHDGGWPRSVEPRLTGVQWKACEGAECGPAPAPVSDCPDIISTHHEALETLAEQPHCTDRVLTSLEGFARENVSVLSDIAAAYYLRAHRDGRESDLLEALVVAEDAARKAPGNPAARFNQALIQESLGLRDEAIGSWNAYLARDRSSEWAKEARGRLERLRSPDAVEQWSTHLAALRSGGPVSLRSLIAASPFAAVEYFEKEVLEGKDTSFARRFASELSSRLGGDRYFHDLAAGGGIHPALLDTDDLGALDRLAAQARQRGYVHFLARVRARRAHALFIESDLLRCVREYDAALETFTQLRDPEMIASVRRSKAGLFRTMGQFELSQREALAALRLLPQVIDARRKMMILSEAASTAGALNYWRASLSYQNAAVRLPNLDKIVKGSALRIRAEIELRLERFTDAERDLKEALRLTEGTPEAAKAAHLQKGVRHRMQEVLGRSLLRIDGRRAAAAFTEALGALAEDEQKTLRASLLAQRSEAWQFAGQTQNARDDLEAALSELRGEENRLLESRRRGEGEEHWSAYFARSDDIHDRLIRLLADGGDWQRAFDFDERSRAYEPLNLILQLDVVPPKFRKLVPRGEPLPLDVIRAQLEPGIVLLQYTVLEDRTITWVIRRAGAQMIVQRATRPQVERWSEALQGAVRLRAHNEFFRVSQNVFDELLAKPLSGLRPERLVIIPDGAMHGLPLSALYDSRAGKYLVEQAPLETAGSATLYVFSLLRDSAMSKETRPSALLVGDPAFDGRLDLARGLKRLPHARAEVERIHALYRQRMNVEARTGSEATVTEFLKLVENRALVHFAGHSIVNTRQPWRSVLLLARSDDHTGAVEAGELVRRLRLDQTRLVVLAACSSAGGRPLGPEGVAPLVRPLIASGVPAIMGSLWDVEDATAGELAVSFHRHYGQGQDAAKALQAAQLSMLRSGKLGLRSVFAWAPYQVVGHASPLS